MSRLFAVVTGGTKGLGAAIAERLDQDGFSVIVVHRGRRQPQARVDVSRPDPFSLISTGDSDPGRERFVHLHGDVTAEQDVQRLVREAIACGDVGVWVNAVGDFESRPLERTSLEMWERMLCSNLTSVMLCCREIIPVMRPHGGVIVNIGVAQAERVRATPNTLPYAIAKNGLVALSRTLAKTEGPHNIRVNVVNPGFIAGGEHSPAQAAANIPLRRLGRAQDVAGAVSFLASEEASYVTGAVLGVDGGVFL
ncbi:SDR family oxidoreductase [Candidatus Bipolaricaulota bacterium]|nr:SDR family oxidoreductase [Candidatus Bipolaricaulota bacterium]